MEFQFQMLSKLEFGNELENKITDNIFLNSPNECELNYLSNKNTLVKEDFGDSLFNKWYRV